MGSSHDVHSRKKQHFNNLKSKRHENEHLQNAYNLHGKNSFIFLLIEEFYGSEKELLDLEQNYLDEVKSIKKEVYNINLIACKPPTREGQKNSVNTIDKMKKTWEEKYKNGYIHPTKGKHLSEEHRIKVIRNLNKACGKDNPAFDHTIYCFENRITKERFTGFQNEFVKKYNLNHGNISNLIKKRATSVKNWIYVKNN